MAVIAGCTARPYGEYFYRRGPPRAQKYPICAIQRTTIRHLPTAQSGGSERASAPHARDGACLRRRVDCERAG